MTRNLLDRLPSSEASPSSVDHVYHLTTTDRLGSLEQGLHPFPERGKEQAWKELEAFLDEHQPEHIAGLGISRRQAVFAHPDIAVFGKRGAMGMHQPLEGVGAHRVALQVDVDPDKVVVCDAGALYGMTKLFAHKPVAPEIAQRYAQEYWGSGMTLSDFRAHYQKYDTPFGVAYERKDEAPTMLPFAMQEPEVLIPQGVTPDNLSWVASSIQQ